MRANARKHAHAGRHTHAQTFATNKRRGQEHMLHIHASYHSPKRKRSMCMLWCVNSAKSRMVKELYGYTDASYDAHMSVGAKRTLLMMLTSNGLFSPVGVACLGLVARCRNSLTEFDSRDSRPREATRSSRRITPVCVSYLLKEKLAILSPLCFSTAA